MSNLTLAALPAITALLSAVSPMKVAAIIFVVEAVTIVLTQTLFALNAGPKASIITFGLHWLIFLPIVFGLTEYMAASLLLIWIVLACSRILNVVLIFGLWKKENAKLQSV